MKERVSATIDKETRAIIDSVLKDGQYRNISHIIEDAIKEKFGKGGLKKWVKK